MKEEIVTYINKQAHKISVYDFRLDEENNLGPTPDLVAPMHLGNVVNG